MSEELIKNYLITVYRFTSNIDGWCVYNRNNNKNIIPQKLIDDMGRVFPNMGVVDIVTNWWELNVKTTTDRFNRYMSNYKLVLGDNMTSAWDVVDIGGREFDFKDLMKYLPQHHNEQGLMVIFDEWFDDKKLEVNMELVKINN